ncbi:MAG: EF-hand domain-containing protein [Novosphingobium sp.]|nr:EF-hand domain-containing protein [Novosphingobium sp.]
MNKTLLVGLSALALVGGGTAALAAHHGGGMKADANGDGIVTRAEAQTGAAAMFAKMDANSDGVLNAADREARMKERRTKMFAAIDADGNGQISREEFMAHKHEGKRGEMRGDKDGMKGGMGHKMGMRGHRGGKMMQMADANKDGSISKAEFTAAAMSRFDKTDANNDGKVTAEERQAAREQMRAKWREMKQGGDAS